MSSIPLPALSVKPPEQPDVLGQYGNLLRLKGLQQGQQLQQQQLANEQQQNQSGALDLQEKQLQIKSQQAMMKAYSEAEGDLSKAIPLASKYGATPQDTIKLQQAAYQQRENARKELTEKGDLAVKQADLMSQAHDTVMAAKPEDRPAVYQQMIPQLQNAGIDVSQVPQQYPGDDQFKMIGLGINAHKHELENIKSEADAAKAKSEADIKAREAQYGTPEAQKAQYEYVLARIKQGLPVSPQEKAMAQAHEAGETKTTTTSDSLGITSTNTSRPAGLSAVSARNAMMGSGASGGKGGAASTTQNIVDLIGQYRTDPATISRMFLKHPEILAQVQAKYPDWDQTSYQAKNKLITSYTSGPQSKEINAINTTMGHVKALDDAVDAMNNGNMTLLNKIGTAYNINVAGKTPEAAFKLIVNRVGPEIASSYIPGGGGEHERIANQNDFDVNLPPQTLHNNAAITVQLLRSKIGALENQYKNEVHRDDFEQRFITPEAQASLNKFSPHGKPSSAQGGGQSIRARDPQGKLHEAPAGTPLPAGWKLEQ